MRTVGKNACAGDVHDGLGVGFHTCSNTGVLHEKNIHGEKKWWCRIHAPSMEAKRRAKWEITYRERATKRDLHYAIEGAKEDVVEKARVWRQVGAEPSDTKALLQAVDRLEDLLK